LQEEFAAFFTFAVFSKLAGVFMQVTALLQPECQV
jgi:hypothetical protein